jgi:hypothetical protein
MVPDLIIIVLGALPLLFFLLTTFPRLRKVEEAKTSDTCLPRPGTPGRGWG